MQELLNRLDQWLQANRPAYYQTLQPGASDEQLKQLQAQFSQKLPESLLDFYRWKNGSASNAPAFQFNMRLMRAEEIVEASKMLNDMIGEDFEEPNWWSTGWVPFLAGWGGDHLCVDLEGTFTSPGEVLTWYHDDEDRPVEYPNFEAWLKTFVTSLEAGHWDGDGDFEPVDDDAWEAHYEELNPGYPAEHAAG